MGHLANFGDNFCKLLTDFKRYTDPVVPVGTPLSKAGGKPETKRRWRLWSSGVPPRPARFRETALAKPAEVRDDKNQRPGHQEYQSVAGVPFPCGTGNMLLYHMANSVTGQDKSNPVL